MADVVRINESYAVQRGGFSIAVEGQPIEHRFDDRAVGEGPARALREAISAGIRGIRTAAAAVTLAHRLRRSSPSSSTTLFNDTGHLAASIGAAAAGASWQITAPPDRLAAGDPQAAAMLDRLVELVPALRAPLEVPAVKAAIERSLATVIRVLPR